MARHVDAIFSKGTFRPLEPLALPEGTHVHLSVEEETSPTPVPPAARNHTPKLARPEDAADFVMEVRNCSSSASPFAGSSC